MKEASVSKEKKTKEDNYIVKSQGPNRKERRIKEKEHRKIKKDFNKSFAQNNDWTNLKTLYKQNLDLFKPVEVLVSAIQQGRVLEYLKEDEVVVFKQNIQILTKDIIAYKRELDMIYNIHKDKDGNCSMEDWGIMMEITEKYFLFTSTFHGNVKPIYDHLADLIAISENRRYILENPELAEEVANMNNDTLTNETNGASV